MRKIDSSSVIRTVQPFWGEFVEVGPRYTGGSTNATELCEGFTTLEYVLANQGIPTERLRGRMTSHDIAEFMDILGIEPATSIG